MSEMQRMFAEQYKFDEQIRNPAPGTYEERTALTKELVLHLISECDEVLRAAGPWKPHRRQRVPENRAKIQMELADVFKYWIMICQVWNFSAEDMEEAFWSKSMAVRQRYSEEWLKSVDKPSVLVDIDNVLCDYLTGFLDWAELHEELLPYQIQKLRRERPMLTAGTVGVTHQAWEDMKHRFRVSGAKAALPLMPGARAFLEWCHAQGLYIVLLTSRPIDRYPNIYIDTLHWLRVHQLPHDFVWWADDKGRLIKDRDIVEHVSFAVDDDPKFVEQLSPYVRVYWMHGDKEYAETSEEIGTKVRTVQSFTEIMDREERHVVR